MWVCVFKSLEKNHNPFICFKFCQKGLFCPHQETRVLTMATTFPLLPNNAMIRGSGGRFSGPSNICSYSLHENIRQTLKKEEKGSGWHHHALHPPLTPFLFEQLHPNRWPVCQWVGWGFNILTFNHGADTIALHKSTTERITVSNVGGKSDHNGYVSPRLWFQALSHWKIVQCLQMICWFQSQETSYRKLIWK